MFAPAESTAELAEGLLVGVALITALGIGAQWIAWRSRLPSILILLLFGFAVGNIGGVVDPEALLGELLFPVVSLSVGIILFEGGLSLRYQEFRQIGRTVFSLVVVGALVTMVVAATAAWALLPFPLDLSVLLGAILVVTGPTVIIPLLQHVGVRRPVGPILKWEGIVIDPVGAMLAVLVFEAILAGQLAQATTVALLGVLKTLLAGGITGALAAGILTVILRRYWVPDFLQNPVVLMFVVVAFTISNTLQEESGLLATPLMGLILANRRNLSVRHIVEFEENLRVLLLAGLFILLGALVSVEDLAGLGLGSIAFLAVLVFVARPLAVTLATVQAKLSWRERTYLACIAPRGVVAAAVSALFAIRLEEIGRPIGARLLPETFFVIVGTVAIYGLAASPLASRLGVQKHGKGVLILGAYAWTRELAKALQREGQTVLLVDTNRDNVKAAQMAGLPAIYEDALSEETLDHIDTEGLGRLLAMTSNEDLNSLAAVHFGEVFERSELYQLSPSTSEAEHEDPESPHLRGRYLFDRRLTFEQFTVRFAAGSRIRTTPITERFTFEDFRERYGRSAVPLFLITQTGELTIYTSKDKPAPRPGQTLISLVEPHFAAATDDARTERRRSLWRRLGVSS